MAAATADKPRRPAAESNVSAKVERPVVDRLREAARENDRSLSGQIRVALRSWVQAQDAAQDRGSA
jgi:hypothetical protein